MAKKEAKNPVGKYDTLDTSVPVQHKKKVNAKGDGNITADLADEDGLPENVKVRHPNRNPDKKASKTKSSSAVTSKQKGKSTEVKVSAETSPEEEIKQINGEQLKMLHAVDSAVCISMYIPMQSSSPQVSEKHNVGAFRSAVQRAVSELREKETGDERIKRLLAPVHALMDDAAFWKDQRQGLAVFIGENFFRYYKMPTTTNESVTVNTSFVIKPLVNIVSAPEYFYILSLSKKQARLFKADLFEIQPLSIAEMPAGMEDVDGLDDDQERNIFRKAGSSTPGGALYHGMDAEAPEKEHIEKYLHAVDETIWKEVLHGENQPLVLAGVEYLLPIFKEVTQYNHVWPDSMTGNFEGEELKSIHARGLDLVKPYFDKKQLTALENYGNKSATKLTSTTMEEIVPAAYYAKVDTLFISKDASVWGAFDKEANRLTIHEEREGNDESLVDNIMMQTVLNGGQVFELDADKMPEGKSSVAALFRYE